MRFFLLVSLFSTTLWAHGEDKPGPNGGMIRMPGSFHTELVLEVNALKIYLLDIQFKNPVVADSAVEVEVLRKGKLEKLSCQPAKDHFTCATANSKEIKEVRVRSTRAKQAGNLATYRF